uniref:Uncharacterized protein n=1 Tax=Manihot esculenta TaxID=3983 RepID=A0A2C9U813_MANES
MSANQLTGIKSISHYFSLKQNYKELITSNLLSSTSLILPSHLLKFLNPHLFQNPIPPFHN